MDVSPEVRAQYEAMTYEEKEKFRIEQDKKQRARWKKEGRNAFGGERWFKDNPQK